MKYIGPFLRINTLKVEDIYSQINFLAKESLNHIILRSKCGICIPFKELKLKNKDQLNFDQFQSKFPLLCIYKKANPKLITSNDKLMWNEDKFKKEVNILGNSLMTLSLLELIEYYKQFKDKNKNLYSYSKLYSKLCKKQLEFFATYLRNEEGIFVDKTDTSDSIIGKINFKEKNKKFNYGNQALLMAAYYGTSLLDDDEYSSNYKTFSLDILNMFLEFKNELYTLSLDEISRTCLGLNIFYKYSKNEESKMLLLDLSEFLLEKYKELNNLYKDDNIEISCLTYLNFMFLYKNIGILKFKQQANYIYENLLNLYSDDLNMFLKESDNKEVKFTCAELMLYLLILLINYKNTDEKNKNTLIEFYKNQLIDSGIILSWPEAPTLSSPERYKNYSLKSEDLLEEQCFRVASVPSPDSIEIAPVFGKYVTFNKKKQKYTKCRVSFDSDKNMLILFLILYSKNL